MGLNGTVELAFDVPSYADVDKEYQHALRHGAISVLPPTTEPWGQRTTRNISMHSAMERYLFFLPPQSLGASAHAMWPTLMET